MGDYESVQNHASTGHYFCVDVRLVTKLKGQDKEACQIVKADQANATRSVLLPRHRINLGSSSPDVLRMGSMRSFSLTDQQVIRGVSIQRLESKLKEPVNEGRHPI